MEWQDKGLIIGVKKHGESSVILEVMTRGHGRHLGLVKGGRGKRQQSFLQIGNDVGLIWRARLDEHLGFYTVEPLQLRTAHLIQSAEALQAMNLISALLHLSAERDPHPALFESARKIAEQLSARELIPALLIRLEILLLAETGFGLDFESCAATGTRENLTYISPKSRRAVSQEAGAPYHDRLLPFPAFLRAPSLRQTPPASAIWDGFRLTEYFLQRDLFGPRGLALPPSRGAYLAELAKRLI
jgi:DNA repair protein RecO (recombination protein O)